MELSDAIGDGLDPPEQWAVGTVTNTSGTQVVVTVFGASRTLPRLSQYSPTIGDVVQIAWPPGRPFVLGKIA